MRSSTKRILSIGLAALVFAITFGVYSALIRPAADEVGKLRAQIATKQTMLDGEKRVVGQIQGFIDQINNLGELQNTLALAIPNGKETFQALNQYQAVANSVNLEMLSIKIREQGLQPAIQPMAKRLGTLQFNLSLKGTYGSIKSFLQTLESNIRVSNLETFGLKPISVGSDQDLYYLDLVVDSYYQTD